MVKHRKRIAMLSPVAWRTPPRMYGAWETVVSNLTEGLASNGWDVTLFATADSLTSAKLSSVIARGYEEDASVDPRIASCLHISEVFEHAQEFDLIHNHFDYLPLICSKLVSTPVLTTIHGFSSPQILPVYEKYRKNYFVSISDSDRNPRLNYLATVYNGINLSEFKYSDNPGNALVAYGRIHPDKGFHLAIKVAKKAKQRLLMAGFIQDKAYFEKEIAPHIDDDTVKYLGVLSNQERNELLQQAYAVLHLNTIPERFGLVMVEAMATGAPVVAMDLGSCREVIADGQTGFLVKDIDQAVKAVKKMPEISRKACRQRVETNFSSEIMVKKYEKVYEQIFKLEKKRRND
ncbi:MAG: glycosyltransferase family 4 protein [Candidatus Bathyarchaeota archaeon]|nr:glycosyltransferase family 4 protein [Candidatus Bathyarchaeota archaeon]